MIILKIGRNSYEITANDQFMDNGLCVQLLSQSKEKSVWGKRAHPLLSKKAIKTIDGYDRIQHDHGYNKETVQVFGLKL